MRAAHIPLTWDFVALKRSDIPARLAAGFAKESLKPRHKQACAGLQVFLGGEGGIRTPGTVNPVRQFSKLVVSATHPPHRRDCKVMNIFEYHKKIQ